MGKRGVIHPVYGITEAAFFGKIRSMLRKMWRHSQPYKDALKRAKKPYAGPGQRKFVIECEQCGDKYFLQERIEVESVKKGKMKEVLAYVVHHIEEAGQLKSFKDLATFAERLFCPASGLQILCYNCHQKTHKKEK